MEESGHTFFIKTKEVLKRSKEFQTGLIIMLFIQTIRKINIKAHIKNNKVKGDKVTGRISRRKIVYWTGSKYTNNISINTV